MSYILEALKKAEHQREIGQVPRIDSEHESTTAGSSSRWIVVVVLILVINAGLLVVLFWPADLTEVSAPVAVSPGALPEAVERPLQPAPRAASSGTVPDPDPVTSVPNRREDTPASKSAPVPVTMPAGITPPAVPDTPAPLAVPVEPRSPPAPVPALAPDPVEHRRNLPVWPQVSAHIFQQMQGNLRLDVHVYSDQPRDRFVLINLQKYHEGEQLQEGPVLVEITIEGVVLSLQGQQFLVRAQ